MKTDPFEQAKLAGTVSFVSLVTWAFETSERKLAEALPRRWAHVQGVYRTAKTLRPIVDYDADLLEAAAILHDVGYAPDLAATEFHPLDGANYLDRVGASPRLVHLVAHHSYAALEAQLRGLGEQLTDFDDEGGVVRDALWYCDQTTSPDGYAVSARERMAEIRYRYGLKHLVTRFITEAETELLAAVDRTEERLQVATSSRTARQGR